VRSFLRSDGKRGRFLSRGVSLRWLFVVAVLVAVVATGVGFAAALAITPKSLTVHTAASAVPISMCTLTSSADSYVAEDDDSNFGSATAVHVRSYQTVLIVIPTNRNRRGFVRFDVASCAIPAAAAVKSATLSIFLNSAPNQNRTWNVHRVTGSWTESGVTWSNQPATAVTASATIATGTTSNVTRQANVLADVASFVSGSQTNNGWRFADLVENSSTERLGQFRSREHATTSQRPQLEITYYP
jgi:hypothetical protein